MLSMIFFLTIGLIPYADKGYWIIGEAITAGQEDNYDINAISEGRKAIVLKLGEGDFGKAIEVKKVSKRGATEVTIDLIEGSHKNKAPYMIIGLDEINEPLKVQTTDGIIFEHLQK